jgi:hypothetical protein
LIFGLVLTALLLLVLTSVRITGVPLSQGPANDAGIHYRSDASEEVMPPDLGG